MRTHDEKLMEGAYRKIYVKENVSSIQEPILIWLTKRIGSNAQQDNEYRPLLLKLLKKLISKEQKRKVSKNSSPVAAGIPVKISTAQVPITPDSFPKASLKKESFENLLKESLTPDELEELFTDSEESESVQ
jgi:hypothetical protein